MCKIDVFPKKNSSLILGMDQTVMMTKEGYTKMVNFMTPGVGVVLGRGHICIIIFFSTPRHESDNLNDLYSDDDQGRFHQICKFCNPLGNGSCASA